MRLVALIVGLSAPAGAAPWPKIPTLPVIVQLEDDGSAFCASQDLLWALDRHGFQRALRAAERPPFDFIVTCAAAEPGKAAVAVLDERRGKVRGIKVSLSPGREQKTAMVVARELGTDKKVVKAAVRRRLDKNAYLHGLPADEAFRKEDWPEVLRQMEAAQESSIEDAVYSFTLYAAYARLGDADKAKWHLAAFAKAGRKRFKDLSPEQLRFLREMVPARSDAHEKALALQQELAKETLAKNWPETLRLTRELVRLEPWFLPAYASLAKTYGVLKWGLLEEHWERREKLARAVSKDRELHDAIEKAALGP